MAFIWPNNDQTNGLQWNLEICYNYFGDHRKKWEEETTDFPLETSG